MVLFEDFAHKLVFCMVNRLDDESIIPGVIKETTALAWRTKLGEDIFACQRDLVEE
jgi:hypothetical protein